MATDVEWRRNSTALARRDERSRTCVATLCGVRADLHTHSYRSDGTDSPAALVRAAAAAGLDVVALTDHDSAAGWDEAVVAATEVGIGFVPGLEISCNYRSRGVHLLGYGVDPTHPGLTAELRRILQWRNQRLPAILARLHALGFDIDADDVRAVAGPAAALGRPHVADALVSAGAVAGRTEAFDRYLSPGRPAYVLRHAAPLTEMLRLVAAAGGVSVLAHPWARGSRRVLTEEAVTELAAGGLTGLETWHRDQSADDARRLGGLAAGLGLVATGSSDYHGTGKVNHQLGCFTTPPEQLQALLAAMQRAADGARRCDPAVSPSAALVG